MSDEVLNYVKLHISRLPKALKAEKPQFNTLKAFDNSSLYTVYKKIPINEIQILISDTDRMTDVQKRFQSAVTLQDYIKENKEDFINLTDKTSVEKIQELEEEQKLFEERIPYFIKYEKNYVWQIFYSEKDKQYFMLFPTKEGETESLFYIIKEKLAKSKKYIYAPICQQSVEADFFNPSKINDLENYIWSFTENWPTTLEYVDEKGKITFYITGQTKIQEELKTKYRIQINSKEEFENLFVLVKALFILMTETKYTYKMTPGIDKNGSLVFYYDDIKMDISDLKDFIASETTRQQNLKYEYKEKIDFCKKNIEKLKENINEQGKIYTEQEKQILNFMNCKKSFFKKVRFFFKNSKKLTLDRKKILNKIKREVEETTENITRNPLEFSMGKTEIGSLAEIFTISDLIKTTLEANDEQSRLRMCEKDLEALKLKQQNMIKKIENADKYLDEIEKHKKSLLEFWKFTNKDNQQSLAEGTEREIENKIEPVFKFDDDIEKLGADVDSLQRKKFSIEEMEAVFTARYLLGGINSVITKSDTYVLDEEYNQLLSDFKKTDDINHILDGAGDEIGVKRLNYKNFREKRRNIYEILRFNSTTSLDDFKEKMREIGKLVNEAYQKILSPCEMNIYYAKRNKGFIIGDINPYEILRDESVDKIYKMKTNKDTHLIFLSNCIFYNNKNRTLPLGMDEETSVITKVGDNKKVGDTEVKILFEKDLFNAQVRTIRIMKEEKR